MPHYFPTAPKGLGLHIIFWGYLLSYKACKELVKDHIKGHPIVNGAYAQGMVSHSGLKEARDDMQAVTSLKTTIASLETKVNKMYSDITAAKNTSESAKKVADKCLSQATYQPKKEQQSKRE